MTRTLRGLLGIVFIGFVSGACSHSSKRAPRPLAYVSDEEGGTVIVLDTDHNVVKTRIAVGKRPRGLLVSHDGKRLYVALSGSPRAGPGVDPASLPAADRGADGIGIVDLDEHKLVGTLKSGQDPESFALSPDDKTLYVSNEETAEMTVVDVASGAVRAKVKVGTEPEGVTLRPDGKVVFVTSESDGEVTAVDTNTLTVVGHVKTAARPRAIVFTADGRTAFVTNEVGGTVTVVDTERYEMVGSIPIHLNSPMPSGPKPMGAVLSRDGKELYVTTGRGGSVAVIDVATRTQKRSIDGVGGRPWGVALSRDGTHVYTANGTSGDVSFVNLSTGNVDERIQVGGLPWGVYVAL